MNICIIAPAFPSKRNPIMNIFIYRQAKALSERGHKVFVIGGDTESKEEKNMVIYARPNPFKSIFLAFRITLKIPSESLWLLKNIGLKGTIGRLSLVLMTYELLKKENIDVIDANYSNYGGLVAYLLSKIHPAKYCVTWHGAEVVNGIYNTTIIPASNAICVITPSIYLSNIAKKYSQNVVTVSNAADPIFFEPHEKKQHTRKTIISTGRLVERKGFEYLLYAMAKVLKSYKEVDLLIAGDGSDRQRLEKIIKDLRISDNVKLLGYTLNKKLVSCYYKSDFFILSTLFDSFGLVFAEAMATGLPVIGTNVGGVPEVIGDGGILVEPKNIDQLVEAMLRLLKDENLRQELSKKALVQARKFSIETRIDRIEEIYKTCKINSE